jgi:Concanavalin A-like lectin/glucanases superfamily
MSGVMNMLLGARTAIAAAVDEFFNRVTLLLPGDGTNGAQNNTFLDSSTNNFTITRNGNTTQGTFSPFSQTGWSNFASAASGSVGFSNSTAALVSSTTSTFTAECWIYMTEAPVSGDGVPALIGMDATFNSSIFLGFGPNASRNLVLRWFDGASKTATGGTALALNTWHHIAVVANSNALAMYVNGVAETLSGTTTLTNRNSTTNTFSLFLNSSSSNYQFRGYASNIRVCTSAVYTGAFTPSTTPLTTTSQGATNCKLLTAQDNRFIDNSTNAYTLTVQGTPSVQAFEPFAPGTEYSAATVGGSGYFDGTGDNLTTPSNAAFGFGTSDFTVEAWVYITTASSLVGIWQNASDNCNVQRNASGNLEAWDGTTRTSSTPVISNTWHHIAFTRVGSSVNVFLNGVSALSWTASVNYATTSWVFGYTGNGTNTMTGYIAGARILKGTGYSSITVPTAPPTAITNTSLLLNFTNAGITDATAKNVLETVGNAQISTTQSKFGGSSMYFDGTGDYLVTPAVQNNELGTGDFTIEGWIYPTNTSSAYRAIVASENYDGTAGGWSIYQNGTSLEVWLTSGQVINATSAITASTWQHIALVRSGTGSNNVRMYVNGTQVGSSATNTASWTGRRVFIGDNNVSGTDYFFNGYIDDLRITRYARYTSSFTAPTAAFALQ